MFKRVCGIIVCVMNKDYLPRLIDVQIAERLKWKGAVCVEGPKWCGKTWSCLEQAKSSFLVGSAEKNFRNRTLAEANPLTALQGERPHLIDEWQEVPAIWDAVRMEVDRLGGHGHFLLTGSATPKIKGVRHSGTGRITKLRMRSMSLYETGDSNGAVSIKGLFDGNFGEIVEADTELRKLAYFITRGGWPEALNIGEEGAMHSAKDYITSFLEDDLPRIDDERGFRDYRKMNLLLQSLARNESTTVSIRRLCADIAAASESSIKEETVNEYLEILRRAFLVEDQMPFTFSARSSKRLKLMPKRHLADPSLAASLLMLTPDSLMSDLRTFGFLFESLAEHDLSIYAEALGGNLYHYQDYDNKEIDAVLQLPDGRWGAFEIKLGISEINSAAENLLKLERKIREDNPENAPRFLAVISGLSGLAERRSDGVYVLPLTVLKP